MNNTPLSNYFHLNLYKDENNSRKKPFTSGQISAKFRTAVLNQTAERGNSNNLQTANTSTPLQHRAFFVRSPNTPQRNRLNNADFLSMVAFGGQGIALDCFPFVTVFPPRQTLSPNTVESVAIAPNNQQTEQIAMIYQFLCVNRNQKTYLEEVVQVQAINEDEARWQLTAEHALLATVGRYPDHQTQQATDRTARLNARLLAKFRPNLTACKPQGFTTAENGDNIAGTTLNSGNRTRQTCGFFAPQIPQRGLLSHEQAEFVARSIRRNKPSDRTNNASRLFTVVEALPRLTKAGISHLLNKQENSQMKTPPPQANTAPNLPLIPRLFARFEGGSMRKFIKQNKICGYEGAKESYQANNMKMTLQEAFEFFEVNFCLMENIPYIYEVVWENRTDDPADDTLNTLIDMHRAYNQALIRDFEALKQDIQEGGWNANA